MRMTGPTAKRCFLTAVLCGSGFLGCAAKTELGGNSVTKSNQEQNTTLGKSACQLSPEQMEPSKPDPIAADCIEKGFYPSHVKVNKDFPQLKCTSVPKASFECTGKGVIEAAASVGISDPDLEEVVAKGAKAIVCGLAGTTQKSVVSVLWIPPKTCGEMGSFVTTCYSERFRSDQFKSKLELYRKCLE